MDEHAHHNFKLIGGAGSSFHVLGADVYAVGSGKKIWKYERYNSKWVDLAKIAEQLAAAGTKMWALDANRILWKFNPIINQWIQINVQYESNPQFPHHGSPQIERLIEGGKNLYVIVAGGDVYRVNHKILYKVGGPAQEFIAAGNLLLSIVNNQVYSPKSGSYQWDLVGSDFKHIIAGAGRVFGVHAHNGFIYEWKLNQPNKPWIPIGNPGSKYVVCQSGLYGIAQSDGSIVKYKEGHTKHIEGGVVISTSGNANSDEWETVAILRAKEIYGNGLAHLPVVIRINNNGNEEVGLIF